MRLDGKINSKAGVSLITVLLFMLVATIAATATYKWITSASRSSSSQMLEKEAYQSSVAGIESARSWMTYHANDVGALIRQYKQNGNVAISLDNQLTELVRPGQDFHVWLTGVNTENTTYKLKIVSEGVSRNGQARHSEAAILNVSGLYTVRLPGANAGLDFDKAFQGKLSKLVNSPIIESAIVNGNYEGNQPSVTRHLIVTGNVKLEGPKQSTDAGLAGADVYIGGTLEFNGDNKMGTAGNVVYVGKDLNCNGGEGSIYIGGDVYVGKNVLSNCGLYVAGNMTVNGHLERNGNKVAKDKSNNDCHVNGATSTTSTLCVDQNLVFTKNGEFHIDKNADKGGIFRVAGSWYAPEKIEAHCSHSDCGDNNGNRKSYVGGNMYRYSSTYYSVLKQRYRTWGYHGWSDWQSYSPNYGIYKQGVTQNGIEAYYYNTEFSKGGRILSFYAEDDGSIKLTPPIGDWKSSDGVLGAIGGNYWSNIDKMNSLGNLIVETGSGPTAEKKVPQAINVKNMVDNEDIWLKNKSNQKCYVDDLPNYKKSVRESDYYIDGHNKLEQPFWEDVQKCYDLLQAAGTLYNGYLVLVFTGSSTQNMQKTFDTNPMLNGKFVFYFASRAADELHLPPTSESSSILLYLPYGANKVFSGGPRSDDYHYNYFIYTAGTPKTTLTNLKVEGSVMVEDGSEAEIADGNVNLRFKSSVLQALADAGFIEQNPAFTARVNPGAAAAGGAVVADGLVDDYYVATAPQLSITLETQYANRENIDNLANNTQTPEGTFIVLPRIVYLPQRPVGSLGDYYSVIPLNTRAAAQNQSVQCSNQIPATGPLVASAGNGQNLQKLEKGLFTCSVTATVSGTQSTVPFYVVVSGNDDATAVSFAEGWAELRKEEQTTVSLKLPSTTGTAVEYTVKVLRPEVNEDEWEVTLPDAFADACEENGECTFTISSAHSLTPIFTVKNVNAASQLNFQITECQGCLVGAPNVETIMVSSSVSVSRGSLESWCTSNSDAMSSEDEKKCAKTVAPDCPVDAEWVVANGLQCSRINTNDSWTCKNTADISLRVIEGFVPNGCEAVVPGDNLVTVSELADLSSVLLYASVKAKSFTFTTGFTTDKALNGDQKIHISAIHPNLGEEITKDCSYSDFKNSDRFAENCQVQVYYGTTVTLSFQENSDKANFNYWMCESGSDCPSPKVPYPTDSYTIVVTGSDKVHAHFNESDKHCFFDEFKNASYKSGEYSGSFTNRSSAFCDDNNPEKEYCIDLTGSSTVAKWRLLQTGNSENIQFDGDGRISFKSGANRRKKESEKSFATVMSTVEAGRYGTLKAQFQVPREGVSTDDEGRATVKQSGFLLRSEDNASSYLMLNVFSNRNNDLKARVCVNGGSVCKTKNIGTASAYQGDIILMAAILGTNEDGDDNLEIRAYTDAFSTAFHSVTFDLTAAELEGVQFLTSQSNQYVGYQLSDQNFKLYGIGWRSADYVSQCWDAYPSISCSFKAAYAGGIVPKEENVLPWVGFSRWFENNGCTPDYYYNGFDAGCAGAVPGTDDYKYCPSTGYYFSGEGSEGVHGNTVTTSDGTVVDGEKTARVGVHGSNCDIYGEAVAWANGAETAHCGSFWVGKLSICKEHQKFEKTVNGEDGEYFGVDQNGKTANLRDAELVVRLDNPNGVEVAVYLFSQGYAYGTNSVYSLPYTTTSTGTGLVLNIDVNSISNVEGFDPERVVGVYVKYESGAGVDNVSVRSRCPHALSLSSCRAEYIRETDTWKVYATVINYTSANLMNVPKVIVNDNEENLSGNGRNCKASPSECSFSANNEIEWSINLDHTPYYNMGTANSVGYQFEVTLTDASAVPVPAEGSPCQTPAVSMDRITTFCSIPTNKKTIRQGTGLPAMTYSITGCPTTDSDHPKCGYTVKLKQGSSNVTTNPDPVASNAAVSGDVNATTITTAANTSDSKLDVGTYKLVLASSNDEFPFDNCEQEFEVVDEDTPTGDLVCDMSENVVMGSSQNITVDNTLEGQAFNIYIDDTKLTGEYWIDAGNGKSVTISAPNDAAEHTYKITKNGDTEPLCTGSFNTVNPLQCSIQNEVVVNQENTFVLSVRNGFTLGYCEYNILGNTSNSNSPENKTFTVTNTSSFTLTARCQSPVLNNAYVSCSVTGAAEVLAPTLTCPDPDETTINAEPGANVTITPISVGNCDVGCTYWVNNATGDKVTPETNGNITTQTSVSFTGESKSGANTYTLSVNNAKGTATCDVLVDYKKPSYSCPDAITAEPGADITVTPTFSGTNYCATNGCDYSITGGYFADNTQSNGTGTKFQTGSLPKKIRDTSNPIGGTALTDGSGYSKDYSLTLTNAAGSGTACDVTVNYKKPTFTCPGNQEVAVNANVTVTPTNVSYCTKGCSYTISGGSNSDVTGSNYTSGALSPITGESTATASGSDGTTYTLTLNNPAGNTTCSFDVKYVSNACTEYMTGYIIDQYNSNKNIDITMNTGKCYNIKTRKACKKVRLQGSQSTGSGTFTINGTSGTCEEYNDLTVTKDSIIHVETNSCKITGMEVYECSEVVDPNNFALNWNSPALEDGDYTVKSIIEGCAKVRFRCGGENCSVALNSGNAVSGTAWQGGYLITTNPQINDVLHVVKETYIYCVDQYN